MPMLIIEDNTTMRGILKLALEKDYQGIIHTPSELPPPKELARTADVIFMDYLLGIPNQTGLDLAKTYRRSGITCPIIFISSHYSGFDEYTKSRISNSTWVKKPWRVSQLSRLVQLALTSGLSVFTKVSNSDIERYASGYPVFELMAYL